MSDIVTGIVTEVLRTRNKLIEAACESAIQGGRHGVIVVESPNLFEPTLFYVEVHPNVPYGHLYHFPSKDALDLWVENGMPL